MVMDALVQRQEESSSALSLSHSNRPNPNHSPDHIGANSPERGRDQGVTSVEGGPGIQRKCGPQTMQSMKSPWCSIEKNQSNLHRLLKITDHIKEMEAKTLARAFWGPPQQVVPLLVFVLMLILHPFLCRLTMEQAVLQSHLKLAMEVFMWKYSLNSLSLIAC